MSSAIVLIPYKSGNDIAIESRPLVLCGDCKYYKDNGATATAWLPCQEMDVPKKWFCASGEEK